MLFPATPLWNSAGLLPPFVFGSFGYVLWFLPLFAPCVFLFARHLFDFLATLCWFLQGDSPRARPFFPPSVWVPCVVLTGNSDYLRKLNNSNKFMHECARRRAKGCNIYLIIFRAGATWSTIFVAYFPGRRWKLKGNLSSYLLVVWRG